MKVVIIGGVAGGASAAARLRRLDEHAQIIIFEKGPDVSFANCGIPYYCGEIIKDKDKLRVQTPEKLKGLLNVDARTLSEVLKINRDEKTVTVLDKRSNQEYTESYDKLIVSPGASPIKPPIEGINDNRIFTVRNLDDGDNIKNYLKEYSAKTAAVIGGGFIGIEMAESLSHLGLSVSIIEMSSQIMNQIDYEIAAQAQNHLREKGVNLYLSDGVKAFNPSEKLQITLNSGKQLDVDLAILSIGVKPEVKLIKECGLEIGARGGIIVNTHLQTSDENIYALGDAIEVKDFITNENTLIPLAGPANKQGRIVAENICGIASEYKATQGSAIVKVFDMALASTGISEKQLIKHNIPYLKSYSQGFSHADYYPEAFPLTIKILFTPEEGKILGAQIIGLESVDKRIDVIASAIKFNKTVNDLVELELSYAPPFGSAKDPVNIAGMVAQNILTGKVKPVYWEDLDKIKENDFILDVRTPLEQAIGSIEGAHNIPLEELRDRINEIPKDKRVISYCTKGLKSYFASRILLQNGFDNVYSLNGGYSIYKQVVLNKQNILTTNTTTTNKPVNVSSSVEIDACGMQCPGPIMKLAESINKLDDNQVIEIKTTDPGFKNDVAAWCKSSNNTLIEIKEENKIIKAFIKKGCENSISNFETQQIASLPKGKTMVVFSNDFDRAMASFIIANGAAAAGNPVTMFFTFWGLNILRKQQSVKVKKGFLDKMFGVMMPQGINKLVLSKLNMGGMGTILMKYVMKSKNVASLQELMEQAQKQGVKFIACQMSMDVMGIKQEELIDNVEIAGVASFINSAENSNVNLFI